MNLHRRNHGGFRPASLSGRFFICSCLAPACHFLPVIALKITTACRASIRLSAGLQHPLKTKPQTDILSVPSVRRTGRDCGLDLFLKRFNEANEAMLTKEFR